MTTINISKPDQYYTQRNNEIRGSEACGPTSAAMFIELSEKSLPFVPEGMSLDDFLMATLIGKEGYDQMMKLANTLYPDFTPNEVHSCLSWAINRICGKTISKFRTNWKLEELVFSIIKGKPVILSGLFNGLNHIVLLVGVTTRQEDVQSIESKEDVQMSKVVSFTIDDPWGDPNTKYDSHKGNDVVLSYKQFIEQIKPLQSTDKWGHFHKDVIIELLK